MRRRLLVITLGIICSLMSINLPFTHDLKGILHHSTDERPTASTSTTTKDAPTPPEAFPFLHIRQTNKLWPIPSTLKVCFESGPVNLRPEIAAAMLEWTNLTKRRVSFAFDEKVLSLDGIPRDFQECDSRTHHDIRIGFVKGDGHWSYIGTDNIHNSIVPKRSMNIDVAQIAQDNLDLFHTILREIVLHETGHALGFLHEHQHPEGPCKNWAYNKIFALGGWKGDTKEKQWQHMIDNIDRLTKEVLEKDQIRYSEYDKLSIMHYALGPEYFTDGEKNPCKIDQPLGLSSLDTKGMIDAYGESARR